MKQLHRLKVVYDGNDYKLELPERYNLGAAKATKTQIRNNMKKMERKAKKYDQILNLNKNANNKNLTMDEVINNVIYIMEEDLMED